MNFQDEYGSLLARLSFPLSKKDGNPLAQLGKTEAKLGIRLPPSLRDSRIYPECRFELQKIYGETTRKFRFGVSGR